MLRSCFLLLFFLLANAAAHAQTALDYRLSADTANGRFDLTLRLQAAPKVFRLAMATHPEYDDRYWRYLRGLCADGAVVLRRDSALWEVRRRAAGPVTIHYSIELPPAETFRPAWKPFLSSGGALLGGPHSFLYLPGKEQLPVRLQLQLPKGWVAHTALAGSGNRFRAKDFATLIDAPLLAGSALQVRRFEAGGVPHRLVYYSSDRIAPARIDSLAREASALARAAGALFGAYPFRRYVFLVQDGAYGGLEHGASATLGIPADQLQGPDHGSALNDIAHEYLHAWNLVAMRPKGYGGLTWKTPGTATELWFSEGFTLYYADLLQRRAKLPTSQPSRLHNLEAVLEAYYHYSGNFRIAPTEVSLAANAGPGALGNYSASPHQQGEVIATLLDWKIRFGSAGRNNLDTAMRALYRRFGGRRTFTQANLQQAFESAGRCRLDTFFRAFIESGGELPMAEALQRFNWGMERVMRADSSGLEPLPEGRLILREDSGRLQIFSDEPESGWARAGVRAGDELLQFNGKKMSSAADLFSSMRSLRAGDEVTLRVRRDGMEQDLHVHIGASRHAKVGVFLTGPSSGLAADIFDAWLRAR